MTTANRPPDIDTINQDSARAAAGDLWLDVQAALNAAPNIADTRGNGELGQKEAGQSTASIRRSSTKATPTGSKAKRPDPSPTC